MWQAEKINDLGTALEESKSPMKLPPQASPSAAPPPESVTPTSIRRKSRFNFEEPGPGMTTTTTSGPPSVSPLTSEGSATSGRRKSSVMFKPELQPERHQNPNPVVKKDQR